jgi:hypothetical protein
MESVRGADTSVCGVETYLDALRFLGGPIQVLRSFGHRDKSQTSRGQWGISESMWKLHEPVAQTNSG